LFLSRRIDTATTIKSIAGRRRAAAAWRQPGESLQSLAVIRPGGGFVDALSFSQIIRKRIDPPRIVIPDRKGEPKMKSKLPPAIRKEILKSADALETLAEYALTKTDPDGFIEQFLVFCDKATALYSIEAATYVMKYVWSCDNHFTGIICKTYNKIIMMPAWRRFTAKCGDFVLNGEPPGFDEIVEIYRERIDKRNKELSKAKC
jgi:hypothetical protein